MSEIRLIDAEALKEAFEEVYPLATNEMGGAVNKRIYDIIDNAPTIKTFTLADIEEQYRKGLEKGLSEWKSERPEGEWIEHSLENLLWGHNECPFCHMRSNRGAHYCQYCGAAMRKGGAENG